MSGIPERYAKALADSAKKSGELSRTRQDLDDFTKLLRTSKELMFVFMDRSISSSDEKKVVWSVMRGSSSTFMKFLEVLIDRKREPLIFNIKEKFDRFADEEESRLRVRFKTAFDLEADRQKTIQQKISEKMELEIILEKEVDPELLGGAVLKIGDTVFDYSVRTGLEKMRKELCSC